MIKSIKNFIRWHISMWLFTLATKISPTYKSEIAGVDGNIIRLKDTTGIRPRDVVLIKRVP